MKNVKKFEEINENISINKNELLNLLRDNLNIVIDEQGETVKVAIYFDEEFISSDDFSIQHYL